jgi:hypothetical protein
MENEKPERVRKPYQKPTVNRFPLRPEEAVLGFCKSNTASGPNGGQCRNVNNCSSLGS